VGQLVIAVRACGVNFPDTLIIQGKYQFQPALPFAPGGEVAGVVTALGEGVTQFKVGDRVMAMLGWGGFAEEAVVPEASVTRLPESMSFPVAASFAMTYGTSFYALKDRARLQPGEVVLVLGAAGGVGLAAVELSKLMGAKVIAAASSAEKLAVCKKYGADEVINYSKESLKDKIKELTGGNGVDVVYDPVGDRFAEPALRGMAWNGRYLVVGFAGGKIPEIPLNLLLLKGCSAMGVFWGRHNAVESSLAKSNLQQLIQYHAEGKLKPHISSEYSLENAPRSLEDMLARKVQGKAVVVMTPGGGSPISSKL